MKNKLKFHDKEELPIHKLPFVGGKPPSGLGVSFWNVPNEGGYGGGCTTGRALALIYLRHLQENGSTHGGILGTIASDMAGFRSDCPAEIEARYGQMIGFFSALEGALALSLQQSRIKFTLSDIQLIKQANSGLAGHY